MRVGKYLYLFSGMQSCSFSLSVMNFWQFLFAAPGPLAFASVQLAQQKVEVSVIVHVKVWCGSLQQAHVLVFTLQSGT